MQTFDLESFVQYIKQRNLATEHHIPFYVQWVQKFLTADLPPMEMPRDIQSILILAG